MKLHAQQLYLQFNGNAVLRDVDFTLQGGELIGLIGPNGAGKTSLLRLLAGLQKPQRGELFLDDTPLHALPLKQRARAISYLEQGAPAHWPLAVERLVELGRLPHRESWQALRACDRTRIAEAMAMAEVEHLRERVVTTLSGGERLRAQLARIFATDSPIILADEPIAALDPYHQLHTMELFREHSERGGSAVVVLHDLNMAARFCHRLVLLQQGTCVADGTPADVLQKERLASVYGIDAELRSDDGGLHVIARRRVRSGHDV